MICLIKQKSARHHTPGFLGKKITMSKEQAEQALVAGNRMTHRFFLSGEFIYLNNGQIRDEVNSLLADFWKYRTSDNWQQNWSIVKK